MIKLRCSPAAALTAFAALLSLGPVIAAPRVPEGLIPVSGHPIVTGGPAVPNPGKGDTLLVYGGPGSLEGKFQDAAGQPDRQGWIGVDLTIPPNPGSWQVSTYQAADLDPGTPGNHAWWCGEDNPSCEEGDPAGGYGNDWNTMLALEFTVADSTLPCMVEVTAVFNVDVEPGYDFVTLECARRDQDNLVLATWTGLVSGATETRSCSLTPADYLPGGVVRLMWHVTSDGGWSDEDCLYPTAGACQIDNIRVTCDQGGGPQQVGHVETCEPGDPLQWQVYQPPTVGVGDFSKVWPRLDDIDPCHDNPTPQFAFIDDGVVVPGTGGSSCISWCYGPDGWVVNSYGGLLGEGHHLMNEIWSPPIAWPDGYRGAVLAFDVWPHLPLESGMFWVWHIRFSTDPAGQEWGEWQDRSLIYYGTARYRREVDDVSDLVPAGTRWAQIALGVYQYGWMWGWNSHDVTPAPYFDNVSLRAYRQAGPVMWGAGPDLPADAGTAVDPAHPDQASVRFDGARAPGDSVVIFALPRNDADGHRLTAPPRMYYRLRANPLFDPYRTSGWPPAGYVVGDSARSGGGAAVAGWWAFDLPDSNFLFPGDVLHVYFRAEDSVGGVPGVTLLPADTTGFSLLPGDPGYVEGCYPEAFTVHALPGVTSLSPRIQPPLLLCAATDEMAVAREWIAAARQLGLAYDLYMNNAPLDLAGIGRHFPQPAGYDAVCYFTGTEQYAIDDADVGVLQSLAGSVPVLVIAGDQVVDDLSQGGTGAGFVSTVLGIADTGSDLSELIRSHRPRADLITTQPGDWPPAWRVDGDCPDINTFDAVTAAGAVPVALFEDDAGQPTSYLAVARGPAGPGCVFTLPWDLSFALQDGGTPGQSTAQLLGAMLACGGIQTVLDTPAVPDVLVLHARPNPFNPRTELRYSLPRAGRLELAVYDLAGRRVRTLVSGRVPAGPGRVTWDGTDDGGRSLPSGVYFAVARSTGQRTVEKVALIR